MSTEKNNQNKETRIEPTNQKKKDSENTSEVTTSSKATQQVENEPVIKNQPKELEERAGQKSSTDAEDYALSVVQSLDQRRIDVDRLEIKVDGETVFGMKDGDIDKSKTAINDKQAELLKQALNDPASMKGSVRITQGKKVLLHVENGRVITDAVGITKESAKVDIKSPESVNEGLYKRHSEGVKDLGLAGSQPKNWASIPSIIKRT